MASLTAVAAVQPVAVKGLAGSSFNGNKLALKRSRRIASRANLRYDSFTFLQAWRRRGRQVRGEERVLRPRRHRQHHGPVGPLRLRRPLSLQPSPGRQTRTSSPPHRSATVDADHVFVELQSKFFETFVAPFTKRGLLLKFLLLGGGFTIAYLGSTASGDILPIKKGPQLPPTPGPRGKI
ncbi:hypothetical protein B296_00022780 [Ensete ventricosum]|uniref:Photosystem I reaction center subunit VI n=1 Tax=Ensete ventricosum TaxID=4639 RepID=A0A426ZN85_ENSVE|nr:hypothetical protein B296_00022780 [Ensete ventricosum]